MTRPCVSATPPQLTWKAPAADYGMTCLGQMALFATCKGLRDCYGREMRQ